MELSLFFAVKVSIVIIVVTGYIVYTLYMQNKSESLKKPFPPFKSKCPDYWDIVDDTKCRNTKKIGKCLTGKNNIMDFNESIFKGKEGDYFKCRWALKCQVPWEGVDNLC